MHERRWKLQAEAAVGVEVRREVRVGGGAVAHVTIANERRLNSLNRALMGEFLEVMTGLARDPDLRLAILTGAGGRAFVGGADINELATLDRDTAREFITLV